MLRFCKNATIKSLPNDRYFQYICSLQLLEIIEIWTKSIDEKISVDVIYSDFAKAFDAVSHEELLYKLKNLGITGKA